MWKLDNNTTKMKVRIDTYMINGLLAAFILNLFGFGRIMTKGVFELTGVSITIAGYYVIFFIIGIIYDLFHYRKDGN